MKKIITPFSVLFCGIIILQGCPNPLTSDTLSVLQDLNPPSIILFSPKNNLKFESSITFSGEVYDVDSQGKKRDKPAVDHLTDFSFIIKDKQEEPEKIDVAGDGSFNFTIPTAEYTEQITIILSAFDLNANETVKEIVLLPDTDGPFLAVTSPVNYSEYATVVQLSGFVQNSAEDESITEINSVINYQIPGTSLFGTAGIDQQSGYFSALIDVSSLAGNHILEVSATDLNGNETLIIINIIKPVIGGDISDFSVTPGNRQAIISWADVPSAESYTLFEASYGLTESNVQSPFIWKGLENGEVYRFQLTAHLPDGMGQDPVSAQISKMPLSELSLAPWIIKTDYKSITIEWQKNPNISSYIVERSLNSDGPWTIRRNLVDNIFTDDKVALDTKYYYRITPSNYTDIPSTFAEGAAGRFACKFIIGRETSDYARGLCIVDDYAYIADNLNGLSIIDISDPLNPGIPVSVDTDGVAWNVRVSQNYAFIADQYSLAIINVSDPEKPGTPSYIGDIGSVWDLAVDSTHVYAACNNYGLAIIDITDPKTPGDPVQVATDGFVRDVEVYNGYAFVVDSSGTAIVDVQNPANPGEPVYIDEAPGGTDITISDDYAYISTFSSGLAIVDISNPLSPGTPELISTSAAPVSVGLSQGYAIVAETSEGLEIIDVNDPSSPVVVRQLTAEEWVEDIYVYGDYIYTASSHSGLEVYTISLPRLDNTPYYPAEIPCSGSLAYNNDYYYVIYDSMLYIYAASDPFFPEIKGSIDLYGSWSTDLHSIAISGDNAYIARTSNTHGLVIVDISKPAEPLQIGSVGTYYPTDLNVCGGYVFGAEDEYGMSIIDISEPASPSAPYFIDTQYWAADIVTSEGYAYIADCNSGIAIIDISDPENPGTPFYVDTPSSAGCVDVSGDYIYAGDYSNGLIVIDVSDPLTPVSHTPVALTGNPLVIEVSRGYVFIGLRTAGLAVIDVSDPLNPGTPVYLNTNSQVTDIFVSGRYAYISCGSGGLAILDLLDR